VVSLRDDPPIACWPVSISSAKNRNRDLGEVFRLFLAMQVAIVGEFRADIHR
jgi:hypothetical protein